MTSFRLSLLLIAAALTLAGCGRKNLPVAPRSVTTPVGASQTPNSDPASVTRANLARTGRISQQSDSLTVTPAEVTKNPGAEKKSFPLDFLLN